MTHYVEESDPELREASNRIHRRILAGLPPEAARRYGQAESEALPREEQLRRAVAGKDWKLASELSVRLAGEPQHGAG